MSYQSQAQLEADYWFQQRNRSVCIQQADIYKDDARPDFVALANAVMRDDAGPGATFNRLAAGGPGVADKADIGNGEIDSALVTDGDLLSLTQANWPVVAGLYFDSTGAPIPGA
jgi:hypothetical protein